MRVLNKVTGELEWSPPFVRSAFNYDVDAASDEAGLRCPEESLTEQSSKDEADINVLIERFMVAGRELPGPVRTPLFGDFTAAADFREMHDLIAEARGAFLELPANLRAEFDNDPVKFVDAFQHEDSRAKLMRLGLLEERNDGEEGSVEARGSGGSGQRASDAEGSGVSGGSSVGSGGADDGGARAGGDGDKAARKPVAGAR